MLKFFSFFVEVNKLFVDKYVV